MKKCMFTITKTFLYTGIIPCALVVSLMQSGCSSSKAGSELDRRAKVSLMQERIERVNSRLPIVIAPDGILTAMSMVETTIFYDVNVTLPEIELYKITDDPEKTSRDLEAGICEDETIKALVNQYEFSFFITLKSLGGVRLNETIITECK